jgi:hypothetical protein
MASRRQLFASERPFLLLPECESQMRAGAVGNQCAVLDQDRNNTSCLAVTGTHDGCKDAVMQ